MGEAQIARGRPPINLGKNLEIPNGPYAPTNACQRYPRSLGVARKQVRPLSASSRQARVCNHDLTTNFGRGVANRRGGHLGLRSFSLI